MRQIKQKLFKHLAILVLVIFIIVPVFVLFSPVQPAAALGEDDLWGGKKSEVADASGFDANPNDPREIAGAIIKIILGFLGIIAVIIILLGGFKWMTGGGSEEKITEAKKLITSGIIGLIIILSAFAIASFVLNQLIDVTG